jgi:hypothetical protein
VLIEVGRTGGREATAEVQVVRIVVTALRTTPIVGAATLIVERTVRTIVAPIHTFPGRRRIPTIIICGNTATNGSMQCLILTITIITCGDMPALRTYSLTCAGVRTRGAGTYTGTSHIRTTAEIRTGFLYRTSPVIQITPCRRRTVRGIHTIPILIPGNRRKERGIAVPTAVDIC